MKLNTSRETFHFSLPIIIKDDWILGLISLEVYNSFFNIAGENKNFELRTLLFDSEFSFTELKDKVAEVLGLSNVSIEDLEHKIYGSKVFEIYRKLSPEKSQTDVSYILLLNYIQSSFRDLRVILEFKVL